MYTSKKQITNRARQWNSKQYVGRNKQQIIPLTEKQIDNMPVLTCKNSVLGRLLTRKGIQIDYTGTGNNKYEIIEEGNKTLIKVPKITSPSLRYLTGHNKVKGRPDLTLKNRLKCKAGPKIALIILKGYKCEMRADKHVFTNWEDVSIDHLISQKRLHLAYLLGIINKNQFQDRNNLTLMRLTKNASKGDTNYFQRTINNISLNIETELKQIKNELNVFLRTTEGQFLLAQQKKGKKGNLVFDSQLVQKALFYYGQSIAETDYFKCSGLSPIEFVKLELKKEGYELSWPEKKQSLKN